MVSNVNAQRIQAHLRQVPDELMGGRGPGAGEAEVASHTRNRVIIAGENVTWRLELAARQTTLARDDTAAITDAIQRSRGELVVTISRLTRRLHPRQLAPRISQALRARIRSRRLIVVAGPIALILLVCARRRSLR